MNRTINAPRPRADETIRQGELYDQNERESIHVQRKTIDLDRSMSAKNRSTGLQQVDHRCGTPQER
jgi:hypothetical protein